MTRPAIDMADEAMTSERRNPVTGLFHDRKTRRISPLLRGYLLLFDQAGPPAFSQSTGLRLLLIFVVLEFVIGPRAGILTWFRIAAPPVWMRIAVMLTLTWLAAVVWAKARPGDIGFLAASKWTTTEVLFAAQASLAIVVFAVLQSAPLKLHEGISAGWLVLGAVTGTQLLWGLYQELIYRGILQSELTRRWGRLTGPIAANFAFTFGPLHFYHVATAYRAHSTSSWEFAGIVLGATFAIGLVFALMFHRTRNIWLVGVLHGLGDLYMEGPAMIAQLSR